jgi:hypothetical protein
VDLDQFTSHYRPVPPMTVAEGIAFLKKMDQEMASQGAAK